MSFSTVLSLAMSFASVGIALILTFLSLFLLCHFVIYRKLMKGTKRISAGRLAWWCVFLCYCFVVLAATLFMRFPCYEDTPVYPLFYSYVEAWLTGSAGSWRNILLNYVMFIPMGFLLALGWKKFQRGKNVLWMGFGFSLAIETLQLITRRGMFEMDDILGNTVGAWIGYAIFYLLFTAWNLLTREKISLSRSLVSRECKAQ